MTVNEKKERLRYPDYIRVTACIFVIVIHVTASNPWYTLDVYSKEWTILMLYNVFVRSAVPLFVMLSGAFLLNPKKYFTNSYMGKKIYHYLVVYILWSFVYAMVWFFENYAVVFDVNIAKTIKKIILYAIDSKYHLWFLPMLVGIYLITPCLRKITEAKSIMEYFLVLFMINSVLRPFIVSVIGNERVISVINRISFEMVSGYAGYFVLGYYLSVHQFSSRLRKLCYYLSIITLIISGIGSIYISRKTYEPQGFLTGEFSLTTFFVAISIFLFFKEHIINNAGNGECVKKVALDRVIELVAENSFGVYLIHVFWIELLEKLGLNVICINPVFGVPVLAVLILILSFTSTWILRKNTFIRKYFF